MHKSKSANTEDADVPLSLSSDSESDKGTRHSRKRNATDALISRLIESMEIQSNFVHKQSEFFNKQLEQNSQLLTTIVEQQKSMSESHANFKKEMLECTLQYDIDFNRLKRGEFSFDTSMHSSPHGKQSMVHIDMVDETKQPTVVVPFFAKVIQPTVVADTCQQLLQPSIPVVTTMVPTEIKSVQQLINQQSLIQPLPLFTTTVTQTPISLLGQQSHVFCKTSRSKDRTGGDGGTIPL